MASTSSTKHRRQEPKIDTINNLPEPILCHILSFLPIRDQISTSSLSKTWSSLWTSVADLNFDCAEDTNNNPDRFAEFVNTVLLRRRHRGIRKFRLIFRSDFDSVNKWVNTAISSNIQELELQNLCRSPPYIINLVSLKNLTVLKLGGGIYIKIGESNLRFPRLMALHINWVCSVPNLLSGCPVLEDLELYKCYDDIRVCVPTLRSLFVDIADNAACDLVLDVPVVEWFSVEGYFFTTRFRPSDHLAMLLATISNVEALSLSCYWMHTPASLDRFPVLSYLVRLEINIFLLNAVFSILESCHNLENIVVREQELDELVCKARWSKPCVVPKCLSSKLKTFQFQGFNGLKDEMGFVTYVLENAMVLKKMEIMIGSHLTPEERSVVAMKLSTVAVGSKACHLIIKLHDRSRSVVLFHFTYRCISFCVES